MFFNTPEFKVGVMVIVVAALIGVMSMKVAEGPNVFGGVNKYWFDLDDANGLVENSAVKVAGIKVGIIEDIELVNGGRARVHLLVGKDVTLSTSTEAEVRADGILGDKHVELIPGKFSDPLLASGSQISSPKEQSSINELVNEVGRITESLRGLADTLNSAMSGDGDRSTPLGRIVNNIENLTQDLADVSGKNKDKLSGIIERVASITENLDNFIADEGDSGLGSSIDKAIASLSRIDRSLRNVEEITDKINSGEGTLGRLVNDEDTIDGINEAVYNVNELIGGAQTLETSLDYHSEYISGADIFKSYLSFRFQPGLDRFYEVAVVDDPRGVTRNTRTVEQVGAGPETSTTSSETRLEDLKFSALFAKNFYDFTVKGGMIESAAGLGFDYNLFRRRLRLSLELYEFTDLNVRAFARYNFFRGVYVVGGGDDLASTRSGSSAFFGAGLFLTNDDLKLFASQVSF